MDADEVIAVLDDSAGYANIVIFDPCRCDSSFAGSAPGLAAMERLPDNVLVVYSAEAGTEAREGLFISSFLDFLERPGWSMVQILRVTGEEGFPQDRGRSDSRLVL